MGEPGLSEEPSARAAAEATVAALRAEAADRVARLRALTLAERGEMLQSACRTATESEDGNLGELETGTPNAMPHALTTAGT